MFERTKYMYFKFVLSNERSNCESKIVKEKPRNTTCNLFMTFNIKKI